MEIDVSEFDKNSVRICGWLECFRMDNTNIQDVEADVIAAVFKISVV